MITYIMIIMVTIIEWNEKKPGDDGDDVHATALLSKELSSIFAQGSVE